MLPEDAWGGVGKEGPGTLTGWICGSCKAIGVRFSGGEPLAHFTGNRTVAFGSQSGYLPKAGRFNGGSDSPEQQNRRAGATAEGDNVRRSGRRLYENESRNSARSEPT